MSRSSRNGGRGRKAAARKGAAKTARPAAQTKHSARRARAPSPARDTGPPAPPTSDFGAVAQTILGACKRVVGATAGYVALSSADGACNEVVFLDAGEHQCTVSPELPMPIRGLREVAYRTAQPVWENDFGGTEYSRRLPGGHAPIRNVMFAPLPVDGKVVGLLGLANKPGGFSQADSRTVSLFGELAAVALHSGQRLSSLQHDGSRERKKLEHQVAASIAEVTAVSRALEAEVAERARAEKALAEREALLQLVLETLPVGVWVADRAGNLTMSNPAGRRIWGGAEYVGIEEYGVYKGWRPDTGAPIEPHDWNMARAITRGETSLDEVIEIETLDGVRKTILASAAPIRDAAGEIVGGLVVNQDVTDRKRAEQAVEQERANLRNILNAMEDGVMIVDADHRVRYVNPAMGARFGSPEGRSCYEYVRGERGCCAGCHNDEVLAGRSIRSESMIPAGGQFYEIFATPVANPDGTTSTLEIFHDITERKRAEQALRESQRFIEQVLEATPDVVYVYDLVEDRSVFVNHRWKSMFGYPEELRFGRSLWERTLHPEDRPLRQARLEKIARAADGELVESEYRVRRADGEWRWIHLRDVVFARTDDGAPRQILGVAQDVTERRNTLAELEESHRFAQQVADAAPDVIYVYDLREKRYLFVNRQFQGLLGYRPEEFEEFAAAPERIVHPDDLAVRAGRFTRIADARDGESVETEYRLRLADGSFRWFQFRDTVFVRDADGAPLQVLGAARDITNRRARDAQMHRLATCIESAGEAVLITNREGVIQYVNPAFERVTGYSRDEANGHTPRILRSGKQDAEFYHALWSTLARGEVWRGRFTNRRKDGRLYVQEGTISPVADASGEVANFVAVLRDITDELRLEEELRRSQKMEALGRLSGGIAHDYKNLMAAALASLELIGQRAGVDVPQREELELAQEACRQASDLTRSLLAFSRQQVLAPVDLDLDELIGSVAAILRRLLPPDISILRRAAGGAPVVRADRSQIHQVLMNLCLNSRDAMPQGGVITIETDRTTLDEQSAERRPGCRPGEFVRVTVADTGAGMDEATLARMFDPFFTTKAPEHGAGLGLATVFGIVQQHGGFLDAQSAPGAGTTVSIYLPAGATPVARNAPGLTAAAGGAGETVLVAEDQPLLRRMVVKMLSGLGYHVLEAPDGAAALEIVRRSGESLDLVLADVVMPGMGGEELLVAARSLQPRLAFILASANPQNRISDALLASGDVGWLEKPFDVATLGEKVRCVLDRTRR